MRNSKDVNLIQATKNRKQWRASSCGAVATNAWNFTFTSIKRLHSAITSKLGNKQRNQLSLTGPFLQ